MNRKGQALVEFVLILPIFLFLIFVIYDFGMIFNSKSNLENDSIDIINLYKNGTELDEIKMIYPDCNVSISIDNQKYYKVLIESSVNLITPGFNRIFGDPYIIYVERYIPYA